MTRESLQNVTLGTISAPLNEGPVSQDFIDNRIKSISNMIVNQAKKGNTTFTVNVARPQIISQIKAGLEANFPDSVVNVDTNKNTITITWT